MKGITRLAVALVLAAIAGPVTAQVLYKLIDRNGKVTYTEDPPKKYDGQVIRIEVNPDANTATLPKFEGGVRRAAPVDEKERATRIAQAKELVEKRRAALEEARKNPGEGDIRRLGTVGGGARPVPSDEYQKRLDDLEKSVKEAEEALREAEGR